MKEKTKTEIWNDIALSTYLPGGLLIINRKLSEHVGLDSACLASILAEHKEEKEISSELLQRRTTLSPNKQKEALEKLNEFGLFKGVKII